MQENKTLKFCDVSHVFPGKSISSVKRSQSNVNYYLPNRNKLFSAGDLFHCRLSYQDYLDFMSTLPISTYSSSVSERTKLIIFYCFLYGTVNTSKLYEEIGISLTTKKKDLKELSIELSNLNMYHEVVSGKGITIRGDEISFRFLTMRIITSISELDESCQLSPRVANNPYEKLLFKRLANEIKYINCDSIQQFNKFIHYHKLDLSYPGRKLLFIYMMITEKRIRDKTGKLHLPDLMIEIPTQQMVNDPIENLLLNNFITSLDHNHFKLTYIDFTLRNHVHQFLQEIQRKIITKITWQTSLFDNIYVYIQKIILRKKLNFSIYDSNLSKTKQHYKYLFSHVTWIMKKIELSYHITFSENEYATACLILKNT